MKYVADDGREFCSEQECRDYEKRVRSIKQTQAKEYCYRKIWELQGARFAHKRGSNIKSTQYTGTRHQISLKNYLRALKEGQRDHESRLEWLARVGQLAGEVIKWKYEEKLAVADLAKIRADMKKYRDRAKRLQQGEPEPLAWFAERMGFERVKK